VSSPGWAEVPVTSIQWDEIPIDWLLDGSTGLGQQIAYTMGEIVIDTNLASGGDPGWMECSATPWSATEWSVYQMSWTEIGADA